jgi:hypothetical protein
MKNLLKTLCAWRERRFWKRMQPGHLRNLIQEDSRWMAHDPIATALTERYLAALADDWQTCSFEPVSKLRSRLGLDPHELERAGGPEAFWRERFEAAEAERARLHDLVNTPELVNFPLAVQLEAVHQVERWGKEDRTSKEPLDWYWLVGYLAGRAQEHHKEAERLLPLLQAWSLNSPHAKELLDHLREQIDFHREKAVHHCITTAAALSHWHASVLGLASLNPGHDGARDMAAQLEPQTESP